MAFERPPETRPQIRPISAAMAIASSWPAPPVCRHQPGTNGECAHAAHCRVLLRRPTVRICERQEGCEAPEAGTPSSGASRNPSLSNHHEASQSSSPATRWECRLRAASSLLRLRSARQRRSSRRGRWVAQERRACTCVGGLPWEACERRRHTTGPAHPMPLDVNEAEFTQEQGKGEVRVEELCHVRCALGGRTGDASHSAPHCGGGDEVERLPLEREGCAAPGDGERVGWGESKRRGEEACPVGHLLSLRRAAIRRELKCVGGGDQSDGLRGAERLFWGGRRDWGI